MSFPKTPYIAWREQPDGALHPRFQPGPRERALGFVNKDLRHEGGAWFSIEEVLGFAKAMHAEIVAARTLGRRAKRPPAAQRARTLEALLEDWLRSEHVKTLAAKTQSGYRKQVNAVIYQPRDRALSKDAPRALEPFARAPASVIGAPELSDFFAYTKRTRGLHMARASLAVVSAALTWGRSSTFWRLEANPRLGMSFEQPAGRVVIFTDAEIRSLVAAADAMARPSIGDAILLGLFTGQRQGDRLALEDRGLADNRRVFEQSKTGARVAIPETPALKARLEAARARVAAIALPLPAERRPRTVIVDETTARPYNEHTYRHVFAEVRAAACVTTPALAGKRDQDLRDTAVTWLARAGATLPEIASITGHSLRSIHQVLQHYLAITPELADTAIAKLVAWMDKEGMAV